MTTEITTFTDELRDRLGALGAPKNESERLLYSEISRQLMRADQTRSQLPKVRGHVHGSCLRIIGEAEGTADGVLYAIETFRMVA